MTKTLELERFIQDLQQLLAAYLRAPHGSLRFGSLNVRGITYRDRYGKQRTEVLVESAGYDRNYGGRVLIDASESGRSVYVFPDELVKVKKP